MSSILINGLVKIHRKQAILLMDEIVHLWTERQRRMQSILEIVSTPPPPKPKVKKPRSKKVIETPDMLATGVLEFDADTPMQLPEVPHDAAVQAKESDITLAEEIGLRKEPTQYPDDFGTEDWPLHKETTEAQIHAPPEPEPVVLPPIIQEDVIALPREEPVIPPEEITQAVPVVEVEKYHDIQPEVIIVPTRRTPPADKDAGEKDLSAEGAKEKKGAEKKKSEYPHLTLIRRRKNFVAINKRWEIYEAKPILSLNEVLLSRLQDLIINALIFEGEEGEIEQYRPELHGSKSSAQTLSALLGTGTSTPSLQQVSSVLEPVQPDYCSTPMSRPPTRGERRETVEQIVEAPEFNAEFEKLMEIQEVPPVLVQVHDQSIQTPLPSERIQFSPEKAPIRKTQKHKSKQSESEERYEDIMEGIVKWDKEENITLVALCEKLSRRVNKFNIAVLFTSLLALAKGGKVLLYSEDDSCELSHIKLGPSV